MVQKKNTCFVLLLYSEEEKIQSALAKIYWGSFPGLINLVKRLNLVKCQPPTATLGHGGEPENFVSL